MRFINALSRNLAPSYEMVIIYKNSNLTAEYCFFVDSLSASDHKIVTFPEK